jgi:hypothetical protein
MQTPTSIATLQRTRDIYTYIYIYLFIYVYENESHCVLQGVVYRQKQHCTLCWWLTVQDTGSIFHYIYINNNWYIYRLLSCWSSMGTAVSFQYNSTQQSHVSASPSTPAFSQDLKWALNVSPIPPVLEGVRVIVRLDGKGEGRLVLFHGKGFMDTSF